MYKCHWFLVVINTAYGQYINSVYGAALEQDAKERAASLPESEVVWLGSYGSAFHAGQMMPR